MHLHKINQKIVDEIDKFQVVVLTKNKTTTTTTKAVRVRYDNKKMIITMRTIITINKARRS
jgi:hypothetical protein